MNLKRHLQHLAERRAAADSASKPEPAEGRRTSLSGESRAAEVSRHKTLADLQQRMRTILSRESTSEPVDSRPVLALDGLASELGLKREDGPAGVFWRRREALRPSQHVGRMPVDGVASVDTRVLSLLALDAEIAGTRFDRALFLDTETTGLGGGAGTYAFLVGLCYFDRGRFTIDQLLLEGPEQEPAMLEAFRERVENSEVVVSFNGKSFDWPLLETRFVMNGLPKPARLPHLDLLHVARRVHKERLARCTLKHLESEVMGFEREGDVEGAEVALRYTHYLRSGDAEGLRQVIEHNFWDVISMAALVALYGEPLPALDASDFIGLARTYRRAKALPEALAAADRAVLGGGGPAAHGVRAEINKARGDRLAAIADFERAHAELDDPQLRLQLAKLYEHVSKQPARALDLLARGVAESDEALARRRARLERKSRAVTRSG